MSLFAQRHFIGSLGALGALGAAGALPGVLTAHPGAAGAMTQESTRIEKVAAGFAPVGTGASGNDAALHREA
jgi:blue copper oxidase